MLFFGDVDFCSDDNSLHYVDIWGHNAYSRYDYNSYFCYYDKISAKPLLITEFGVDAYDTSSSKEYQDTQSKWVVHEWEQIKGNSLGGIVMEYSDEWWKRCGFPSSHDLCGHYTDVQPDSNSNEEWYGVMAVKDNGNKPDIMLPRKVYYALQQAFGVTGSLKVMISPQGAITAGAKWRRKGTSTWLNSGNTESGVPVGSCTVEFKAIAGWNKPANKAVTINKNQTTSTSGTYVKL
jgi:hypothetical protein